MPERLSEHKVRHHPAPERGEAVVFDSEATGLALKVTAAGDRKLIFAYSVPETETSPRRARRIILGAFGDPFEVEGRSWRALTIPAAREAVDILRGQVRAGRDPWEERRRQSEAAAMERDAERAKVKADRAKAKADRAAMVTFADTMEAYIVDRLERGKLKESTAREYRRIARRIIGPAIGQRPVRDIGDADKDAVRAATKDRPIAGNRCRQFCSAVLTWATGCKPPRRDPALDNPFVIPKGDPPWYPEEETRTSLSIPEAKRLEDALQAADTGERGGAVDAIALLYRTGWRRGEVLSLRWDALDLETRVANLPTTKTGPSERALSRNSVALLRDIARHRRRPSSPYVFPSPLDPQKPRENVRRAWDAIRDAAGLSCPLHSLRHTRATFAYNSGQPLATVAAMVGHKDPATTLRYAKIKLKEAIRASDATDDWTREQLATITNVTKSDAK
jgi:integrase